MFRSILAFALFAAVALPAMAQDYQKFEVGAAYSYIRANVYAKDTSCTSDCTGSQSYNLQGGKGEFVFNPSHSIGLVAEFGGYDVTGLPSGSGNSATLFTYLFGPRLNIRSSEKFTPFVEVLLGGAHVSTSGTVATPAAAVTPQATILLFSGTSNAFAMAAGGGIDVKVSEHVALRLIQADYLMTRFSTNFNSVTGSTSAATQNNFRVGAGLQFRF
jgi:opacity protein-like surface antigen